MVWVLFASCVLTITLAGFKLSQYADAISDKTGLGGSWVGVILLASVTSLPELVTGISSVTMAMTPDIAVGDIMGSCVFNLVIIVVIDFLHRPASIFSSASQGHILSAAFGIILIAFAGFNIHLATHNSVYTVGHVGLYSPVITILYLIAMRTVFVYEKKQLEMFADAQVDQYPELTKQQAYVRYAVAAGFIVIAGSILPFAGHKIAVQMGWYESFVGTLLIAVTTSLPEIVVTLTALRLGAVNMAIGNLFGSNLFNIFILSVDDVFYTKGSLLANVSPTHGVSALSAVMMTGLAIVGLFYQPKTKVFKQVGWVSIFLFSIYIINSLVMYLYGV